MIVLSLFSVNFSAVFYVLISAVLGLLVYSIGYIKNKNKKEPDSEVEE